MWHENLAAVALVWPAVVLLVICIGTVQLYRHLNCRVPESCSSKLPVNDVPHVTVIRPVVGLEPYLEDCLESTFTQDYPSSKLIISFCISSPQDPSLPILQKLLAKHPDYDARIYVETEDPNLRPQNGGQAGNLGPNPKIRNMSRAYREAKGDIIWIADCNVWLHERTAGLMVDLLCGLNKGTNGISVAATKKYKFVHQLPLAVDVSHLPASLESVKAGVKTRAWGGLLEELFMSTAHVKFYTAISTVAIAPCTVGKSNMFRRSHLDALTQPRPGAIGRSPGIDFFSENICEDHLIGDLLWKSAVPVAVKSATSIEGNIKANQAWRHHALLLNPPCIQPQYNTKVASYAARRNRWLRVRKFTVPVATLVEPGTESFVACAMASWGLTTNSWANKTLYVPQTWTAFVLIWLITITCWALTDRAVWTLVQSWSGQRSGEKIGPPVFVGAGQDRSWGNWLKGWLVREALAFPVWAWAILGGTRVLWRGREFWVGLDMKVHEITMAKKKV